MDYSFYPIKDSNFYKTGEKSIGDEKVNTCLQTQGYSLIFLKLIYQLDTIDH